MLNDLTWILTNFWGIFSGVVLAVVVLDRIGGWLNG